MAANDSQEDLKLAGGFWQTSRDDWLGLVEKVLKGRDFDSQLVSQTASGVRVAPLYTRADEITDAQGAMPGAAPFARGTHVTRTGLGWDIRQLHANEDPEQANTAILADLNAGVSSIVLQIKGPGQFGLEPTQENLACALKDVRLDWAATAFAPGAKFLETLDAFQAVAADLKIDATEIHGALNADPIGYLARTGTYPNDTDDWSQPLAQCIKQCETKTPSFKVILADARPYHEAGANEAQELAALAATLVAYMRSLERQGIDAAATLRVMAFAISADVDVFLTISKLRAARRIIWRVADAAGLGDAAIALHLTASTSERVMTKRDPWNNMLRACVACTGAALGGADAITVLPFTWPLGQPDAFALRTARNTQIVLQEESNLGRVIDPAGGSWYVEKLSDDLAQKAWELFQDIEREGGIVASLKAGALQGRIAQSRDRVIVRTAKGSDPLTGTTTFPLLGDDGVTVEAHVDAPEVVGEKVLEPLAAVRLAKSFEDLRDAGDTVRENTGHWPRVFLANLGAIAEHSARSTWVKNLLAAGGIEALTNDGFEREEDVVTAFQASRAQIACLCSSDTRYDSDLATNTLSALKNAGAKHIYLAGRPGTLEEKLKSAGVTRFLFAGQNNVDVLKAILSDLDVAV